LYFVDNGGQGLYAMQGEVNIKIPIGKGIAGTVATSKEIINIPNAYEVRWRTARSLATFAAFYVENHGCFSLLLLPLLLGYCPPGSSLRPGCGQEDRLCHQEHVGHAHQVPG